jgi:hypothetical protein
MLSGSQIEKPQPFRDRLGRSWDRSQAPAPGVANAYASKYGPLSFSSAVTAVTRSSQRQGETATDDGSAWSRDVRILHFDRRAPVASPRSALPRPGIFMVMDAWREAGRLHQRGSRMRRCHSKLSVQCRLWRMEIDLVPITLAACHLGGQRPGLSVRSSAMAAIAAGASPSSTPRAICSPAGTVTD